MSRIAFVTVLMSVIWLVGSVHSEGATIPVCGEISTNTTWTAANTYYVECTVTVNSGVTLAIQSGTVVKFNNGVGLAVNGTVNATGTNGSMVYFTDLRDDTVGGDTNGDGSTSTPGAGWWGGIEIYNGGSATLNYSMVSYGGGSHANVYKYETGSLTLTNSTVSNSSTYGIRIENSGSNYNITGSTISNNAGTGISIGTSGTLQLQNNIVTGNGGYGLDIGATVQSPANGNTVTGNTAGSIMTWAENLAALAENNVSGRIDIAGGTITQNTTLNLNPLYVVAGTITVNSGATLAVPGGTIVKFNKDAMLKVNGTLTATGTSANKIYFTDLRDDTVGGDTNGDGSASSPAAGWWVGIEIHNGGSAMLNYSTVRYGSGGSGMGANIYKDGAGSLTLTNSTVSNSYLWGVYIYDSASNQRISGSTISNNGAYGIVFSTVTGSVTIIGNRIINNGNIKVFDFDDWAGIHLISVTGTVTITDNNILYNRRYGIDVVSSNANILRNIITANDIGVYCDNSNPVIGGSSVNGNNIAQNTTYGVKNATSSIQVNARYNWWGTANGPYHATLNPHGAGNPVSDYVNFVNYHSNPSPGIPLPPVKLNGSPDTYYYSIGAAYASVGPVSNLTINVKAETLTENLDLDRVIDVTVKGGLASDFITISGFSFLQGILTIGTGSLTVENLCIK